VAFLRVRMHQRNGFVWREAPPFLLRRLSRLQNEPPSRAAGIVVRLVLGLLLFNLLVTVALIGAGAAVAAGTYAYYTQELAGKLDELKGRPLFETSRIYDRNGYLLYEVFLEGRRTRLDSLDQVPPALISATLSAEDKTFWDNPGVDPVGIARAAFDYVTSGRVQGGGSTLTQQFIRNALFTYEERTATTLDRKLREILLALEMTRTYSKNDILLMYLNEIPYGNMAYGIEAAAQIYFGKHASELDLAQCAFLSGLPQSPTDYNPFASDGLERAKSRQRDVLDLMVANNYITQAQADAAYAETLRFSRPEVHIEAPHFVMWVRQLLEEDPDIGPEKLYGGGLSIYTSLDMRYQRLAEAIIHERMDIDPNDPQKNADVLEYNTHNAAMIAMRPDTGEILAMVGSVDYNLVQPSFCGREGNVVDGNVNTALAERQPGSSIKPINYLSAFSKGWGPATMVLDVRTEFPVPGHEPYAPENYLKKFNGPIRLRYALGGSLNMPAVKVLQFGGVPEMIDMAHRLGVQGLNRGAGHYGLSLTLGGGEVTLLDMVTANATLANEGRYVPPVAILKVVDSQGNVLKEYKPKPLEQQPEVADPRFVYLVTNILSDDTARQAIFGAHSILQLSRPAAVKTGTSEDWADNWTLGFTPYLVVGSWVGNNNNEPMTTNCQDRGVARSGSPGIRTAGRIWHNFMEAIFHPDDPNVGLAKYFPDEEKRAAYFGNGDLQDVLRYPKDKLRLDFRRPAGIVEREICADTGMLPSPYCPVTTELFVEGMEPKETDTIHKLVTVIQFPGSDPPQYCLPAPGVVYPPELVHQIVFVDYMSVAKPEEVAGLQEWLQQTGTPVIPTTVCPPEFGTLQPAEPGQPPPQNRWAGLVRAITYPRVYQGITGPIEIRGSADLVSSYGPDQFASYRIEWGQKKPTGEYPDEWYPVGEGSTPVHDGVLTYWDPAAMPDGSYLLRLTVVTKGGVEPGYTYLPIYLDRGLIYARMTSPQPGAVLNQDSVTLAVKVEGVSPAARVDFFYDGIFIGSAVTNTIMPLSERVYTVTWTVRPGQHKLTAEVTNTAGRHATTQQVLVIGEPPSGSLPGEGRALAAVSGLPRRAFPPELSLSGRRASQGR
jgi:membrane peptidoglycan carboxypeptidase